MQRSSMCDNRPCYEYRPISQTVFMLSIAINRAEHVCAAVIIKDNYMLMCNYPPRSTVLFAILNRLSTGRITQYCL